MQYKLFGSGGVLMNIIIDKNVASFIRKSSKENAVTIFMKPASGG
jgi:hypothetical protein